MTAHEARGRLRPRVTIKTRMSLWFTLVLSVICALLLVSAAHLYGEYGKQVARDELVAAVRGQAKRIREEHGFSDKLKGDELRDADFAQGDVQLTVYDEEGGRYAGVFLHDELDDVSFSSSDKIRSVTLDGGSYYCYDEHVRVPHDDDLWVRGIVRAEPAVWDLLGRGGFLVWFVGAMIVVAFVGGRMLAGRLLRPVREIDVAAREIRKSADLSRRVPVVGSGDELSALADDMNDMLATLERNFEAERAFTSSASHELRTPISVILAECEYAEENASGVDELRASIATIHRQGAKISGIVESLLMLTRLEQGVERYASEELDLSSLVRSACDDFAAMTPDARMRRDLADGVRVVASRELVGLAVDNLLRNARRYGGTGVTIDVSLASDKGMARICVTDDGPGIAPDEVDRVWELFYRADASRSSEGLGIGLPLVRRIAERYGGGAFVRSTVGVGSTFSIELPVACEPADKG